jgi:hypothetical protein
MAYRVTLHSAARMPPSTGALTPLPLSPRGLILTHILRRWAQWGEEGALGRAGAGGEDLPGDGDVVEAL